MSETIKIYRDLAGANDHWAGETRSLLSRHGLTLLNLIGAPGSGKTALLERTAARLQPRVRLGVLEGDIETTRDAERLAALRVPVSQLLTGGACHLEARLVHAALRDLPLENLDLVVVENVGNLVCPAEFDIGEAAKVAVLSVTEGEDKPLKYPLLFREAGAVVITKTDLLPYIPATLEACQAAVRQINSGAPIFPVSVVRGDGLDDWILWLEGHARRSTRHT
jgi:hydrogenase nickel incorporation protein HypB